MASAAVTITNPADQKVILPVNYNQFTQENQKNYAYTTNPFTITNSNADNASNIPVAMSLDSTFASAYNIVSTTINSVTTTGPSAVISNIAVNGTATVYFTINVTHSQNPGTTKIGGITINGVNAGEVDQVTEQMLQLRKLSVDYVDKDGKASDKTISYDTESTADLSENVKAGTDMAFTFDVKNLFTSSHYENTQLTSLVLEVSADNDAIFPSDFETEYDLDDLEYGKTDKPTFTFTIPDDADTGNYRLTFTLTGEDDKGIQYKQEKTLTFALSRASNDLRITKYDLNPSTVSNCAASTANLNLQVKNFGSRNQNAAAVSISNPTLKISVNEANLVINRYDSSKNSYSKTYTFSIPSTTPSGTYPLTIGAYYNTDSEMDTKIVNLIVEKCPAATPNTTTTPATTTTTPATTQTSTTTVTPAATTTTPAATTTVTATPATSDIVKVTESGYNTEDYMVGVIIVMIVLLLAVVIVLAAALFR